jgi:predicted AAA+ superfamily ATPase
MHRIKTSELVAWKNRPDRLPLLLLGARQTGKTYLLEAFGRDEFPVCHRFDFAAEPGIAALFEGALRPDRIVRDLSILRDADIDPRRDLLILDEIQECPRALTALKYFAEQLPGAFVAASGSLLGAGLGEELFPVGKVERLELRPMTFTEFLRGTGDDRLAGVIEEARLEESISRPVHDELWRRLKTFFIVGGLPGIVNVFRRDTANPRLAFEQVRRAQASLLADYADDISKHSGKIKAVKIGAVWKSIPVSLAREVRGNRKFVFKDVLPTASRYATLEGPIEWLLKAGLAHKVPICREVSVPLAGSADQRRFKLYLFDVGLLGAMVGLAPASIHGYDYDGYKGYFAENFVLEELVAAREGPLHSWSRNTSEVEFLVERDGRVFPVEVKAGINTKAKSLRVYFERYAPPRSVLFSGRPMGLEASRTRLRLPLYLASQLDRFLGWP